MSEPADTPIIPVGEKARARLAALDDERAEILASLNEAYRAGQDSVLGTHASRLATNGIEVSYAAFKDTTFLGPDGGLTLEARMKVNGQVFSAAIKVSPSLEAVQPGEAYRFAVTGVANMLGEKIAEMILQTGGEFFMRATQERHETLQRRRVGAGSLS